MKIFKIWRPRITTTGQVIALKKYRGRVYVRFRTPMAVEVSTLIEYTDRDFTRLKSAMNTGTTVNVKY